MSLPAPSSVGDPDRGGLAETQRHHKADARAIKDELVRPERCRPQKADQDAGGKEDTDLQPPDPADRQTETEDVSDFGPVRSKNAAQHVQGRQARDDASAQRQTGQHQPLIN